jgi:hypothetical protein
MALTLELPAELEQSLRQRAAANGQDVASFVGQVVAESLGLTAEPAVVAPSVTSRQEFQARLQRIIDRHAGTQGRLDDSRESIYSGRGE